MLRPAEPAIRPDACLARPTHAPVDRAALWSICFALFAAATSLSSLFVILPSVGRELGMTTTQVGLVIAPAGLLFVLAGPAWGRFGANLPRGPVLSVSLTAIGILTLLFGVVIDLRLAGRLPFLWCFGLIWLPVGCWWPSLPPASCPLRKPISQKPARAKRVPRPWP